MAELLTTQNVVFIIGILGVIFSVYRHFRDPQNTSELNDALMGQQMKHYTETTEKRFSEIQENFKLLLLQSNNHIHTVDTKVDKLHASVNEMGTSVTKLGTIIEERIPRK